MTARLRRLTTIHLAFCAGLAIITGLYYYLAGPDYSGRSSLALVIIGLVFAFATLIVGLMLPAFILSRPDGGRGDERDGPLSEEKIREAYSFYHRVKIIQWMLLAGGGTVCGAFYVWTAQPQLLAGAGIVFLFLLSLRPSRGDFLQRAGASAHERLPPD